MNTNTHHRIGAPNPWVGLSSYADPATSPVVRKFCGRDRSTTHVTHLIDENLVVTLYGRSGIGKTSLLNAGVFPRLRKEQYLPLSLRLGLAQGGETFQKRIITALKNTVREKRCSIRTFQVFGKEHEEEEDYRPLEMKGEDFLWRYFATHKFYNSAGQTVFPVIVLDQFEEVYRDRLKRNEADILLAQLHYMADETHIIEDCIVDGEEYSYDFNFRFVLSIREDDLFRLEDSIDNGGFNLLKSCRYRLRGLSEEDAHAIISIPGEGLFPPNEEEALKIRNKIIEIVCNEDRRQRINPNIFSLVCSRLFIKYQQHPDEPYITLKMVEEFGSANFFVSFYQEATRNLSPEERTFIESRFVDRASRRRVPVSEELLREKVTNWQQLLEGDNRILQQAPVSTDDEVRFVELLHDSFCAPLLEIRRRQGWISRVCEGLLLALLAFFISITVYLFTGLYGADIRYDKLNRDTSENISNTINKQNREKDYEQESIRISGRRL